jgi:hypothetical protein
VEAALGGLVLIRLARAVPLWAWALAAALLWGGWQHRRAERAGAELLRQAAETAKLREQALHAALIETTRRQRAVEEVSRDASEKLAAARRDAAGAARAAAGLRDHVAELAARAAAVDSCTADSRAAAAAAAGVLAELQRRADERAGILARYADEARTAGEACERAYDTLTRKTAP